MATETQAVPARTKTPDQTHPDGLLQQLEELRAQRDVLAQENRTLHEKLAAVAAYNWDLEQYI